jgi:mannose-6-phosphate isomerase-like protein (cupin superfamily)
MATATARFVNKPWGNEEIFAHTERYVGKILSINAGESLSLQYHRRKDETLRVLSGEVELIAATAERLVTVARGRCSFPAPGTLPA